MQMVLLFCLESKDGLQKGLDESCCEIWILQVNVIIESTHLIINVYVYSQFVTRSQLYKKASMFIRKNTALF
jgi:hypothetical protein